MESRRRQNWKRSETNFIAKFTVHGQKRHSDDITNEMAAVS